MLSRQDKTKGIHHPQAIIVSNAREDYIREKKTKMINTKMAINSQLSKIESKWQTKQTSRTETESQIWRPFGWLSAGRGRDKNRGKGRGIKKLKLGLSAKMQV